MDSVQERRNVVFREIESGKKSEVHEQMNRILKQSEISQSVFEKSRRRIEFCSDEMLELTKELLALRADKEGTKCQ